MDVAVRRVGDLTVLRLTGKILGGAESDALRTELDRCLAQGHAKLLIDLTLVPWMNSAGLGILLSGYSRAKDRGTRMAFCGVGDRVCGILRTTKLLTVLDIFADEEAGIHGLSKLGAVAGEEAG